MACEFVCLFSHSKPYVHIRLVPIEPAQKRMHILQSTYYMVDSLVVSSEVLHEVIHWPSLETEREKPGPTHMFIILIIGATGKASANPSPSQAFYTITF